MAKKQTFSAKTVVGLIIAMIFVAAITFGVMVIIRQIQVNNHDEQANAQDINTADTPLKTEEDLKDEKKVAQSSNDAKDRMDADERNKPVVEKNDAGLNIAEPIITFVAAEDGQIVAGGSIPNINETSGTCIYIFTKGDVTVTENAGILPNPSYISCETVRIPKSKFTNGTWSIKIKYKSNTSEGESETQTYTIQ